MYPSRTYITNQTDHGGTHLETTLHQFKSDNHAEFPPLEEGQRRNPFIAFLLSLLLPGMGQLYNGQFRKAILVLFLRLGNLYVFVLSGLIHHFIGFMLLFIFGIAVYVFSLIDAIVVAILKKRTVLQRYQRSYIYISVILVVSSYSFFLPTNTLVGMKAMIASGPSMEPTLISGDRFVIDTHIHDLKQGDIVVLRSPKDNKQQIVKRVIALGGDDIEIKDNVVTLNGKPLDEPYITKAKSGYRLGLTKIPQGQIFVLGDSRDISYDSHIFGPLPKSMVIGKANFIYFSRDLKRIGIEINK